MTVIGILQTGRAPQPLRSAHGDYHEMSRQLLALSPKQVRHYAVMEGQLPENPELCNGWLITGSPHGVYEPHSWIPPLETFIRHSQHTQIKMVGICFGHQIIAQALGGQVKKFAGGLGVGILSYTLTEVTSVQKIQNCAWHQDQIVTPPKTAQTIAKSDFCAHAGLTYGKWGLSFQAHPEFSKSYLEALIDLREGISLPAPLATQARSSLKHGISPNMGEQIRKFLLD